MKEQMLYQELGKYYDLIYSKKDYKKESEVVKGLINKYKKSDGNALLDVACGTGRYLAFLKDNYKCTGTDINEGILAVARKNVKGVEYHKADMINFNLHKQFDIITCLFSSIGYVKTYENLKRTIDNFSRHLKNGGVLIIEPWINKKTFDVKKSAWLSVYEGDDIKIARMGTSKMKGDLSILTMHYLVGKSGKEVEYYSDRHFMGLFDVDKTLEFMRDAGLKPVFLKKGLLAKDRGLYVCVKK